jgi:hypothetical protein
MYLHLNSVESKLSLVNVLLMILTLIDVPMILYQNKCEVGICQIKAYQDYKLPIHFHILHISKHLLVMLMVLYYSHKK